MTGAESAVNAEGVEAPVALDVGLESELEPTTSHAATHSITANPVTASRRRRAGAFGHAIACNPPWVPRLQEQAERPQSPFHGSATSPPVTPLSQAGCIRPETGSFASHPLRGGLPLRRRAVNRLARKRAICLCPPTTLTCWIRSARILRAPPDPQRAPRIGATSQTDSEMHVATPQTARDFQPVMTAASGSTMRAGREPHLDAEFHITREACASMRTRTLVLTKWPRCRNFMASKDTQYPARRYAQSARKGARRSA
jgi:hypothetical protein